LYSAKINILYTFKPVVGLLNSTTSRTVKDSKSENWFRWFTEVFFFILYSRAKRPSFVIICLSIYQIFLQRCTKQTSRPKI